MILKLAVRFSGFSWPLRGFVFSCLSLSQSLIPEETSFITESNSLKNVIFAFVRGRNPLIKVH